MDNLNNNFEKFFDVAEENRDIRIERLRNSLTVTNILLFVIAIALCVIAFCQFYNYKIQSETINTVNNTVNEIYQNVKPYIN